MRKRGFEVVSKYEGKGINIPTRHTAASAGYDMEAAEETVLAPHRVTIVPTGLKAYMQPDEYLALHVRSGFSITLPHAAGLWLPFFKEVAYPLGVPVLTRLQIV